ALHSHGLEVSPEPLLTGRGPGCYPGQARHAPGRTKAAPEAPPRAFLPRTSSAAAWLNHTPYWDAWNPAATRLYCQPGDKAKVLSFVRESSSWLDLQAADAAQRAHTPDDVGGEQADHDTHDDLALAGFQKIGQHPGNEYEQDGHGDQLKSQARLVGIDQAEKEENNRHHQRRCVAEVAGAAPDEKCNQPPGNKDDQGGAGAHQPDQQVLVAKGDTQRLPSDIPEGGAVQAGAECRKAEGIGRPQYHQGDRATGAKDSQRRSPAAGRQVQQQPQSHGQHHPERELGTNGQRQGKTQQQNAAPIPQHAARRIECVGNRNGGENGSEGAPGRRHFRLYIEAGCLGDHQRRKAIKSQGDVATRIAVKTPRHVPDRSAQQQAKDEPGQAHLPAPAGHAGGITGAAIVGNGERRYQIVQRRAIWILQANAALLPLRQAAFQPGAFTRRNGIGGNQPDALGGEQKKHEQRRELGGSKAVAAEESWHPWQVLLFYHVEAGS